MISFDSIVACCRAAFCAGKTAAQVFALNRTWLGMAQIQARRASEWIGRLLVHSLARRACNNLPILAVFSLGCLLSLISTSLFADERESPPKPIEALPLITPFNFDPADPGEYSRRAGIVTPGSVAAPRGTAWPRTRWRCGRMQYA